MKERVESVRREITKSVLNSITVSNTGKSLAIKLYMMMDINALPDFLIMKKYMDMNPHKET